MNDSLNKHKHIKEGQTDTSFLLQFRIFLIFLHNSHFSFNKCLRLTFLLSTLIGVMSRTGGHRCGYHGDTNKSMPAALTPLLILFLR